MHHRRLTAIMDRHNPSEYQEAKEAILEEINGLGMGPERAEGLRYLFCQIERLEEAEYWRLNKWVNLICESIERQFEHIRRVQVSQALRLPAETSPKYYQKYGLTKEHYEELVREQKGRCAICQQKPKRKLVVDHNHETTKRRQLLCNACNSGLGFFRDKAELMQKAAAYIESHNLNA